MIALLVAMMAARVEPHMIMATPKPYGNPDNSPLTSSNYPCKVTSDPATFYKTDGIIDQNSMVAGENQTLSFTVSNAPEINHHSFCSRSRQWRSMATLVPCFHAT